MEAVHIHIYSCICLHTYVPVSSGWKQKSRLKKCIPQLLLLGPHTSEHFILSQISPSRFIFFYSSPFLSSCLQPPVSLPSVLCFLLYFMKLLASLRIKALGSRGENKLEKPGLSSSTYRIQDSRTSHCLHTSPGWREQSLGIEAAILKKGFAWFLPSTVGRLFRGLFLYLDSENTLPQREDYPYFFFRGALLFNTYNWHD